MTDNIYSLAERRRIRDRQAMLRHAQRERANQIRECIEGIFADSPYRFKGL